MESVMDNWKFLLDTINTATIAKPEDLPDHLARILSALAPVVADRGYGAEELALERLARKTLDFYSKE
jgi:hypothetical protein